MAQPIQPEVTTSKAGGAITDKAMPLTIMETQDAHGQMVKEVGAVVSVTAEQIGELVARIRSHLPAFFYDTRLSSVQRLSILLQTFHIEVRKMIQFADDNVAAEKAIENAVAASDDGIITTNQLKNNSCVTSSLLTEALKSFGVDVSQVPGLMNGEGHAFTLLQFGGEKVLFDANNPIETPSGYIPLMHTLSHADRSAFHNGQGATVRADFGMTKTMYPGIEGIPTAVFECSKAA